MKLINQVSSGLIKVALLAALGLLIGCAGGTEGTRTKTANVQVLQSDGSPAAGVLVSGIALDGTQLSTALSDASGNASAQVDPLGVTLSFSSAELGLDDRIELGAAGQDVELINITVQQDQGTNTVSVKEISVELSQTPDDPAASADQEGASAGGADELSTGSRPTRPKPAPNDPAAPGTPDGGTGDNTVPDTGTNTNTTPNSSAQAPGGSGNYNSSGSSSTPTGSNTGGGSGSNTATDPANGGSSSGSITDPAGNGSLGDPSRGDQTDPARSDDTSGTGTRGR